MSIGTLLGSLGQKKSGSLNGDKVPSGYSKGQLQQFTPQQLDLFKSMFSNVSPDSYLSKLSQGDEETFNELEAPAMRQFQGIQGQLASRFSGMGMGSRKSSGFQNTSNQAASDFAQDLQSKRMGLRNQAIKDLMGMSNELLGQRPYEKFLTEKPKSFLHEAGTGLAGVLGKSFGSMFGG